MDTNKEQQLLLNSIREELAKKRPEYKPSSFYDSVWFYPQTGGFLFQDTYVGHEIVVPLIESKLLTFKGVAYHQGEKMIRFGLSN